MNFIKEKKINKYIMIAALFLSFGYSGFYYMRGALALLTASGTFVFNDVWAFLFAAVIGGGVYLLLCSLRAGPPHGLTTGAPTCSMPSGFSIFPQIFCREYLKLYIFIFRFCFLTAKYFSISFSCLYFLFFISCFAVKPISKKKSMAES